VLAPVRDPLLAVGVDGEAVVAVHRTAEDRRERSSGAVAVAVHKNFVVFWSGVHDKHGDVLITFLDRAKANQAPVCAVLHGAGRAGGVSVNRRRVAVAGRLSDAAAVPVHKNFVVFWSGVREKHGDVLITFLDRAKANEAPIRARLHPIEICQYVGVSAQLGRIPRETPEHGFSPARHMNTRR
jgi:hypothetical protein